MKPPAMLSAEPFQRFRKVRVLCDSNTPTHTHLHIHTHTHTHGRPTGTNPREKRPGRREVCQPGLEKIENRARENKMHFNENKSNVLLVTTKTSGDNRTLNIYLNNKRLEQVSELTYLRIYFDSRFSFDRHVDYITGICTPITNMLVKSAKLKWGLGHRELKVLYNGATEPILTYGAPVWEKDLTNQNNSRKYQGV